MTAALILAAGEGRRMGGPKALLRLDGETLLRRAARTALEAGCAPVVAVVGTWPPGLDDLRIEAVMNPDPGEGMAGSIRRGIAALPPSTEAVVILVVDQPTVDPALLRRLLALAGQDPGRPAACAYAGTLGVPAVLPRRFFPELSNLQGDRGARSILLREGAAALPFPDGEMDLDTPADLDGLRC